MAFIHSSPRPIQFIFLRLLDGGNNNNDNNEMNNNLPSPPSSQSTTSSSINNNNQLKKSQVEFIPGSSSKVRCVEMGKHNIEFTYHFSSLSFLISKHHLSFYIYGHHLLNVSSTINDHLPSSYNFVVGEGDGS